MQRMWCSMCGCNVVCNVYSVMSPVSPLASSAYIAFFFPFSSALMAGTSSALPFSIICGHLLELEPSGVGVAGRDFYYQIQWIPFHTGCYQPVLQGIYEWTSEKWEWRVGHELTVKLVGNCCTRGWLCTQKLDVVNCDLEPFNHFWWSLLEHDVERCDVSLTEETTNTKHTHKQSKAQWLSNVIHTKLVSKTLIKSWLWLYVCNLFNAKGSFCHLVVCLLW